LTQFLALQMVNFSSLHDEGRPDEVLYRYRRNALVNALRMVIKSLILSRHHRQNLLAGTTCRLTLYDYYHDEETKKNGNVVWVSNLDIMDSSSELGTPPFSCYWVFTPSRGRVDSSIF
jgi:hypothetical protein